MLLLRLLLLLLLFPAYFDVVIKAVVEVVQIASLVVTVAVCLSAPQANTTTPSSKSLQSSTRPPAGPPKTKRYECYSPGHSTQGRSSFGIFAVYLATSGSLRSSSLTSSWERFPIASACSARPLESRPRMNDVVARGVVHRVFSEEWRGGFRR